MSKLLKALVLFEYNYLIILVLWKKTLLTSKLKDQKQETNCTDEQTKWKSTSPIKLTFHVIILTFNVAEKVSTDEQIKWKVLVNQTWEETSKN